MLLKNNPLEGRARLSSIALTTAALVYSMQTANAEQIVFHIVAYSMEGKALPAELEGKIHMRTKERAYYHAYDVPANNPVIVSCEAGTYFKAEVTDEYAPVNSGSVERPCKAGKIDFYFKEKAYASLLRAAKSGTVLAGMDADGDLARWQAVLATALQTKDAETTLKTSAQLYNVLKKKGTSEQAEPYRVLNFDVAKTKLTNEGELVYDPDQKRYVLGPDDIRAITTLQEQKKLKPSGRLDWPTMHYIAESKPFMELN